MSGKAGDPDDPAGGAADDATLSTVVAAVVASFARGRASADLATVRLAREYQRHELLRGIPVPRLRLNKVAVSIPLVVTGVRRGRPGQLAQPPDIVEAVLRVVGTALKDWDALSAGVTALFADATAEGGPQLIPDSPAGRLLQRTRNAVAVVAWALLKNIEPPGTREASPELRDRLLEEYARVMLPWSSARSDEDPALDLDLEDAIAKATERVLRRFVLRRRVARRGGKLPEGRDYDIDPYFAYALGERKPEANEVAEVESTFHGLSTWLATLFDGCSNAARAAAFARSASPPEVTIEAPTASVKAEANSGTVTRINLLLSEHGMEWVSETGPGDDPLWRLVQE